MALNNVISLYHIWQNCSCSIQGPYNFEKKRWSCAGCNELLNARIKMGDLQHCGEELQSILSLDQNLTCFQLKESIIKVIHLFNLENLNDLVLDFRDPNFDIYSYKACFLKILLFENRYWSLCICLNEFVDWSQLDFSNLMQEAYDRYQKCFNHEWKAIRPGEEFQDFHWPFPAKQGSYVTLRILQTFEKIKQRTESVKSMLHNQLQISTCVLNLIFGYRGLSPEFSLGIIIEIQNEFKRVSEQW
jgi:hypothetical protein